MAERAQNKLEELGFQLKEIGKLGKLPIFMANTKTLEVLIDQDEYLEEAVKEVEMNHIDIVNAGDLAVTYGANPCFAGVTLNQGQYFLHHQSHDPHSIVGQFGSEGVLAGSSDKLEMLKHQILSSDHQIAIAADPEAAATLVVVRRKVVEPQTNLRFPQGIYIEYSIFYGPQGHSVDFSLIRQ